MKAFKNAIKKRVMLLNLILRNLFSLILYISGFLKYFNFKNMIYFSFSILYFSISGNIAYCENILDEEIVEDQILEEESFLYKYKNYFIFFGISFVIFSGLIAYFNNYGYGDNNLDIIIPDPNLLMNNYKIPEIIRTKPLFFNDPLLPFFLNVHIKNINPLNFKWIEEHLKCDWDFLENNEIFGYLNIFDLMDPKRPLLDISIYRRDYFAFTEDFDTEKLAHQFLMTVGLNSKKISVFDIVKIF